MQEFLARHGIEVEDTVTATKRKIGGEEALEMARASELLVVARGRNVRRFDLRRESPDDETLLNHLLGPTGNLRAPTVVRGGIMLVGFNEDEFAPLLTAGADPENEQKD